VEHREARVAERRNGRAQNLKDYQGFLQADAYGGDDKLFASGKIIEAGCWAHVRRKFYEIAVSTNSEKANTALAYIKKLYEREAKLKYMLSAQRQAARQAQAKPILKEFKGSLEQLQTEVLPKSPLASAIAYTLKLWEALNVYVEHGFVEIDNNRAERAMKVIVLGRKNWLFAGSHQGAKHAAVIYSLIETCKQNDVEPYAYLTDMLARLPSHPINRIKELLPYNWRPQPPPEYLTENILQKAA